MTEATTVPAGKRVVAGWVKTILTSLAGALSGAVLMYASTIVDMVIKPAKPLANFQSQASGLTVTLQNKSTGGHDGWWDFGDASALEPFVSDQPAITHTYTKPGSYAVKLSLKNLLGEENDRTVTVAVEQGGGSSLGIDTFDVVPTHGNYAPATFRVVTAVHNADLCVWAVGNRALEFSPETANGTQERLVTFKEPGTHILKLAAYNGKHAIEKSQTVDVKKAPAGSMTATVDIAYDAVFVEQKTTSPYVHVDFPANQQGTMATVTQTIAGDLGFEFLKADLAQPLKNPGIKSAKVAIDPAHRDKATLTCQLSRPSTKSAPPYTVQLTLTQQRQSPLTAKAPEPVSVNLTVPGSTKVPLPSLPPGWVVKNRKMSLTLQQDGKQVVWKDNDLPRNTSVLMSTSTPYVITASEASGQLTIDVGEVKKAWSIVGN